MWRAQVTPTLVDARTGTTKWTGEPVIVAPDDPFSAQSAIATKVVDALEIALRPTDRAELQRPYSSNPEAFASYERGKAIFTANGCNSCHTLTAAGANAKVGPDLDQLPAEAQRAGQPLAQFVKTSIVDPNAYVEHGFPKGTMPTNFGTVIKKNDLDTLVQYLIQSSKGGGK